jgi:hypothetical protein
MNRRGGKHRRSILGRNGTFTSNRPSTTVSPKNETDAPATMGARGTSGRSRTRITAKSWPSDAVASSRAFGTCFNPISPPQNPSPATFTDHSMTISSATPLRTRTPSIVGGIFPMSKNARNVKKVGGQTEEIRDFVRARFRRRFCEDLPHVVPQHAPLV